MKKGADLVLAKNLPVVPNALAVLVAPSPNRANPVAPPVNAEDIMAGAKPIK